MSSSVSRMFSVLWRTLGTKAPRPEDTVTPPVTADIEGVEPLPVTTQRTDSTVLAEPTTSSAETVPPVAAEVLPKNEVQYQ